MTRFEVWAPVAGRVELVTQRGRFPMRRGDGGWWRRELAHDGDVDYAFPRFGPYLSGQIGTQWGRAPNLDGPDSDEVRRLFIDSALAWLRDYHGDGLRLDAVHALVDRSPLHFLEELRAAVDRLALQLGGRCS